MAKRFYVENLPPDMTEEKLREMFSQIGEVESVKIKTSLLDGLTGHPKGSGIVDMALDVDAYRAVNCFEGAEFKNGKIHLKEEDPLMEKARHVLTDITEGYEQFSTKIGKEMKDIERKIGDKIEEIKKH